MAIEQLVLEDVSIRILADGRVSRADAAKFLGFSAGTLANWKCKGFGPKSRKVGGREWYNISDLKAFVAGGIPSQGIE